MRKVKTSLVPMSNPSSLRHRDAYVLYRGWGPDNVGSAISTADDIDTLKDMAEYQQGRINENYFIIRAGDEKEASAAVWKLPKRSGNPKRKVKTSLVPMPHLNVRRRETVEQKETREMKELFDRDRDAWWKRMAERREISESKVRRRKMRGRNNPAADADTAFESFHGEPSGETVIIEDQIHEHEHLWVCGRLIEMFVVTQTGFLFELAFDEDDAPYLCCSEDGRQLYIEGGDQEIDLAGIEMDDERWLKDRMVIGTFASKQDFGGKQKHNITYRTKKDFDGFEEVDYQHELGESSKELRNPAAPFLEYEPRNKKLYITGGQYIIKKPLFGTSPGIEN
jgi:hypothetical protein